MKTSLFCGKSFGIIFVCALGMINHFLYNAFGNNIIVGIFTPVNDSVWEHLKLLFFPFMFYVAAEYFLFGKRINGFLFSRFVGVMCGMIFIPLVFYAYTLLFGKSILVFDILIFILSVLISFRISTKLILNEKNQNVFLNISGIILFLGVTLLFAGFTFFPPSTPLFYSA